MTSNDPRSVILDRIATAIFGDDWAAPTAAWIGVNLRTLQRIRIAARAHAEHDAALGALKALDEAIGEIDQALQAAGV